MKKKVLTAILASTLAIAPTISNAKSAPDYTHMSCEEIAEHVNTLEQFQEFMNTTFKYADDKDTYGKKDYIASAKRICDDRKNAVYTDCNIMPTSAKRKICEERKNGFFVDDCDAAPMLASRMLGRRPRALLIYYFNNKSADKGELIIRGHAVYLDKKDGKYGAAGIGGGDYRPHNYPTIKSICRSYNPDFPKDTIFQCFEVDFSKYYPNYGTTNKNMAGILSREEIAPKIKFAGRIEYK